MTTRERLALAAAVSAGLHALLISGAWWPVARAPGERQPLEARLAPAPRVAEPARAAVPRPKAPAPRRAAPPAAATVPPLIAQALPALPAETQVDTPSDRPEAAPATGDRPEARQDAQAGTPGPDQAHDEPAAVLAAEPAPARALPRKGTITFTLTFGRDGFGVGRAVQSWEVGSGSYKLASDAETTGIVDLVRPQRLRWLSKGTLTRQGLRPESFLVSRTRRGQTEAADARFDWGAGSLTYGPARERTSAALPGGAQDIMSFIYQLALSPPAPGRFQLPITTGSRFETYEIEVRSEEEIEIPLGTIRALPVRQRRRPGTESIEIWLATQYHYLPVKIRYFDREGNPAGEQVASDIRVSED